MNLRPQIGLANLEVLRQRRGRHPNVNTIAGDIRVPNVVGEEMARQFSRRSGIPFIALRFSNIMEPHDYARFPSFQGDPLLRKWNLWGYVDARDVAQSCRLGLEADMKGAESFIIAAGDTCMLRPNSALMAEVYPGVPLKPGTGDHDTLLSVEKARQLLGYKPAYTWRKVV